MKKFMLIAACLLLTLVAFAQDDVTVTQILADRDGFDGKSVVVTGEVHQFHTHTLKDGTPYTTFMLSDGQKKVRVFLHQQAEVKGARVKVTGSYGKKDRKIVNYILRNGVLAEKVEKL